MSTSVDGGICFINGSKAVSCVIVKKRMFGLGQKNEEKKRV